MSNYLIEEDDPRYPEYQAAVINAMLSVYIHQPSEAERACGYDPQKLLPDLRSPLKKWVDDCYGQGPDPFMVDLFRPREPSFVNEYIDFNPEAPMSATAKVLSDRMTAATKARQQGVTEETYRWKMAIVPAARLDAITMRALIDDRQVRSVIIDFDSIADDVLGPAAKSFDEIIRERKERLMLDALSGEIGGKPVAMKPPKPYLDHDPTKNHRRRRRK